MIFGGEEKPWMSRWWIQGVQWVHMHPLQKFQKYDFIAIIEGFWTIKHIPYELHYFVWLIN